jgi:hypothetical protein
MTGADRARRIVAPGLAGCALLTAVASAGAARPPTLAEREAIVQALPASVRNTPVECLWLKISVSTRNPSYALVSGTYLNARGPGSRCTRYARNGFDILRKSRSGWRIIYSGSDWPLCSRKIPSDLVKCRRG